VSARRLDRPHKAAQVFDQHTSGAELLSRSGDLATKTIYPVVDERHRLIGVVTSEALAALARDPDLHSFIVASDLMGAPIAVTPDDNLAVAFELMRVNGLPQLPVVDRDGQLVGVIDEAAIAREYLRLQAWPRHDLSGGGRATGCALASSFPRVSRRS
jgi:CIC family chloride channel protein